MIDLKMKRIVLILLLLSITYSFSKALPMQEPLTQFGYGMTTELKVSPDNTKFLVGTEDGIARLFDIETGNLLQSYKGHQREVTAVGFSSNGSKVITGSYDKSVRIFDAISGNEEKVITDFASSLSAVAFSAGDSLILGTAYHKSKTSVFGTTDWELRRLFSVGQRPVFTHDGSGILASSGTNNALILSISSGEVTQTFSGHSNYVRALAVSSNGLYVATGSIDSTARIWNASTGESLFEFGPYSSEVTSVAFSSDDSLFYAGTQNGVVYKFEVKTGNQITKVSGLGYDSKLAVCGDLAMLKTSKNPELWDLSSDSLIKEFEGFSIMHYKASFWGDDSIITSTSSYISFCNQNTSEVYSNNTDIKYTQAIDKSNNLYYTATASEINRKDSDGNIDYKYTGNGKDVRFLILSKDNTKIAAGVTDSSLLIWNVNDSLPIRKFTINYYMPYSAAFTSDGKKIACSSGPNSITLFDIESGDSITAFPTYADRITFSPNDSLMLTMEKGTATLWSVITGEQLITTSIDEGVYILDDGAVAFDNTGDFFFAGAGNGIMEIWSVADLKLLVSFRAHTDAIKTVEVNSSGTKFLTASSAGIAKLWKFEPNDYVSINHPNSFKTVKGLPLKYNILPNTITIKSPYSFPSDVATLLVKPNGRVVKRATPSGTNEITISTEGIASGAYFICVDSKTIPILICK